MSRNQMAVLSQHSLEYISSSYAKVRRPRLFISHLSIILSVPGAAASIDRDTLDRALALISSVPPEYLEFLLHALATHTVTVGIGEIKCLFLLPLCILSPFLWFILYVQIC